MAIKKTHGDLNEILRQGEEARQGGKLRSVRMLYGSSLPEQYLFG